MRHRAFARDIVFLSGGAFMGFELNLVVQNAQNTILDRFAVVWLVVTLLFTASVGYWLNHRDERRLVRPAWAGRGSPYPGLQPFSERRAGVFFGRDDEIHELAGRLVNSGKPADARFVAVVGASGGGKSSLLQAGLKPRLVDTGEWTVLGPVVPGSQPVDTLAGLLARVVPALADAASRTRFTHSLRRASGLPSGQLVDDANPVLSTQVRELRNGPKPFRLLILDQFEEIFTLASPNERNAFIACLIQMLDEDHKLHIVAALRSEFLTEFLDSPAARLLRDPYVLPSMDEAGFKAAITGPAHEAGIVFDEGVIDEMLRDAQGGDGLPLLAYLLRELCPGEPEGVRVTLSAYRATGGVAGALKRQADAVLERLADRHEADEVLETLLRFVTLEGTEPTRRRVLVAELTAEQRRIVTDFIEARLLVSYEDALDLSHEAMLRQWEPLQLAISRQEDALRRRTNLEPRAREWDREGRRDDFLLRGERLYEVQTWLEDPVFGATPLLQEFIEISVWRAAALARDTADVVAGHALRLLSTYPELAVELAHAAVSDCSPTPYALYALARALDAPLRSIRHRGAPLKAVACSGKGDLAVVGADDILVWSGPSFEAHRLFSGGNPQSVAWSATGDLAVGMADGTVKVWQAGLAGPTSLQGPGEQITAASWSPEGRLSCLDLSGVVRTWHADLDQRSDHNPGKARGTMLVYSRDGVLAVGYDDGSVEFRKPGSDSVLVSTRGGRILSLAWSADGTLAVGSTDGLVRVLNTDGIEVSQLSGHGGRALSVAWSPDGVLASGSDNGEIHVWRTGQEEPTVLCGHRGSVWALEWFGRSSLVSVGEDGNVLEWSTETDDQVLVARELHRVLGVAWSPRSELAYTSNTHIKVSSVDGTPQRVLDSGSDEAWAVGWSVDGSLAAGSADGTVRVWHTDEDNPVIWQAHQAGIWSVAWSRDGRLATGSNDGSIRVWQTPGGECSIYDFGDVEIWAVAWSTDGRLAAGADDGFVRVWRPGVDEPITLAAGKSPVWIVDWSAHGRLAASSGDGVVRVWERNLLRDPIMLEGHGKGAWSVAWSADDRLAAGAGDGTIRIWSPGTDDGPIDVAVHQDGVWLVAWSPEGRLASSSQDNSVRITSLPVLDADRLLDRYEERGFRDLTPEERRRYHLPVR